MKSFFYSALPAHLIAIAGLGQGPSSCSGGGSGGAQWQLQLQLQAAQRRGLGPHIAAIGLGQHLHNVQTQASAGAVFIQALTALKNLLALRP